MEKEVKKNYNKKRGVLPVVITLVIIIALLSGVGLIFAFVYPKQLADFSYGIGLNSYAVKLYERDWEKSDDINSLYSALNITIKVENNEKTIALFEEFYANEEYADFVKFIDEENLKIDDSPLIKASLLNEDNYLKNKYVSALISENQVEKAFEFALVEGIEENPTYNQLGNFLFGNFVTNEGVLLKEKFNTVLNGKSDTLLNEFYNYFNKLSAEFKEEYNNTEVFYIVAVANRAQLVGNTINSVLKATGNEQDNNIVLTLQEINENLSTKLMD